MITSKIQDDQFVVFTNKKYVVFKDLSVIEEQLSGHNQRGSVHLLHQPLWSVCVIETY